MTIMRNELLESRLGCVAGIVGAGALAIAAGLSFCSTGCTPAERATVAADARWADSKILLPITEAVCEVETATQPPAGWVDVVCSWAEGIEARIADPPADSGVGLTAATVKAPATLRMRLTVPRAKQLALAHPTVLTLPKGL